MSATCLRDEPGLDGEQLLAAFADDLRRTYTLGPPPPVGPALAEVLAAGTRTAGADRPAPLAPQRAGGGFLGRLQGRRPRLVLGAAAASLTFLGVGAAGALPGPAQSAFDRSADAVGITLPATDTRDSTAPDARGPDQLGETSSSGHQDGEGAGTGQDAGPTVPVPPAGDRRRPVAPDAPLAADASDSGPGLGHADVPGGDAGGRTRQPHVERPAAEDRLAPGPARGKQPEARGGPPSGVGAGVTAGPDGRPGTGLGRTSKWSRASWDIAPAEPSDPAAGAGLGQGAGRSAEAPTEAAYPYRPSRR